MCETAALNRDSVAAYAFRRAIWRKLNYLPNNDYENKYSHVRIYRFACARASRRLAPCYAGEHLLSGKD
jgi:hypothetical protein